MRRRGPTSFNVSPADGQRGTEKGRTEGIEDKRQRSGEERKEGREEKCEGIHSIQCLHLTFM